MSFFFSVRDGKWIVYRLQGLHVYYYLTQMHVQREKSPDSDAGGNVALTSSTGNPTHCFLVNGRSCGCSAIRH